MKDNAKYQEALGNLRIVLARLKAGDPVYDNMVAARDEVLARYQPVFRNPDALVVEEFKSFLYLENNRHWSGLYRKGLKACEDASKLRQALRVLLDETRPIDKRIDDATGLVRGMGKGLTSAILLVMFPDKYGVWNNTSESGLRELGLWPSFDNAGTLGKKYIRVNSILTALAHDLNTDLWTLDAIWWAILAGPELPKGMETAAPAKVLRDRSAPVEPPPIEAQRFGLERHLHEFLLDNWDRTELGRDWAIYGEDDDSGYEFPTDVGRIDLLAKHRREKRWLVVELKRDQTDDATVGQVLRYIGWVRQHMADQNEQVEGLIIAHEADEAIRYAISAAPGVRLLLYEVEFRLNYAATAEDKHEQAARKAIRLGGLWKDLLPVSEAEMADARREMWGKFGERAI